MILKTPVLTAAGLLFAATVSVAAAGTTISGSARASAGDQLVIHGARIQLFGITAPAPGQSCPSASGDWPCGNRSLAALARRVDGKTVTCRVRHRVGHGHWQAVCHLRHTDIGGLQVRAGWARALPEVTAAYAKDQAAARAAHKGIWRR